MDDFCCFGDDRERLRETREAIREWLWRERRLELNPKRWQVLSTDQPSTFLGYRVSRAGIVPGRKLKRRLRKRLRTLRRGKDLDLVTRSLRSYSGWMTFG